MTLRVPAPLPLPGLVGSKRFSFAMRNWALAVSCGASALFRPHPTLARTDLLALFSLVDSMPLVDSLPTAMPIKTKPKARF
eukprot:12126922-Heterocapsa_arctica.AAC.1